jgi:hypothetical protein
MMRLEEEYKTLIECEIAASDIGTVDIARWQGAWNCMLRIHMDPTKVATGLGLSKRDALFEAICFAKLHLKNEYADMLGD